MLPKVSSAWEMQDFVPYQSCISIGNWIGDTFLEIFRGAIRVDVCNLVPLAQGTPLLPGSKDAEISSSNSLDIRPEGLDSNSPSIVN